MGSDVMSLMGETLDARSQWSVSEVWQNQLSEAFGFGCVRVTRKDESADAHCLISLDFLNDLLGIANDGCATATAGLADSGP